MDLPVKTGRGDQLNLPYLSSKDQVNCRNQAFTLNPRFLSSGRTLRLNGVFCLQGTATMGVHCGQNLPER
jgi:hypothetical protein